MKNQFFCTECFRYKSTVYMTHRYRGKTLICLTCHEKAKKTSQKSDYERMKKNRKCTTDKYLNKLINHTKKLP